MDRTNGQLLSPVLFVGLGGMGSVLLIVLRAYILRTFGYLPECIRFLAIDFKSDSPEPPRREFGASIPASVWDAARLTTGEQCLLGFGGLEQEIAAKVKARDDETEWLSPLVDADVLEKYTGAEGSQIPMIVRVALSLCAYDADLSGGSSWVEALRSSIGDLAPNGRAIHDMVARRDLAPGALRRLKPLAIFIAGAQGGTGTGALLPVTIVARWLAERMSVGMSAHALVLAGHYREKCGQEQRMSALNYALDRDIEYAMDPSRQPLEFPIGPEVSAQWAGALFDEVYRLEANGRLKHNEMAVWTAAAEQLRYFYFTAAGFSLRKSRANNLIRPALRRLSEERSWDKEGLQ